MKIALIIAGICCLMFLGGPGCAFGAYQYSKIGATDRFSQYGSLGRGIGATLDKRYEQRAYIGFGMGSFFSFIGLVLIGGTFFVGKKKDAPQAGWQQPQQGWQQPQQPQQGWQQPPQGGQGGPYG